MLSTYAATPGTRNPIAPMAAASPYSQLHWLEPLASAGTIVRLGRDAEIVAQDEPSDYCYQIVSGCVRTAMVMENGRRQIGEFLFPGDLLGYETTGRQPYAASSVTNVVLRRFRRSAIENHAARDAVFDQHLRQYMAAQLRSARNRLALLGRGTAGERIMSFLREMQARLCVAAGAVFEIPMKLTDVADYLGLAIETVCRGVADLRKAGVIAAHRTQFAIQGAGARVLH
jgi:CRP/FNR family nitrogen fixation transcriptional regulator